MSKIKRVHKRFLVYVVFALTCIRAVVARVLPFSGSNQTNGAMREHPLAHQIKHGLRFRIARVPRSDRSRQLYSLELTGTFPFVKVATLAAGPIHVPVEIAALSPSSELLDLHAVLPHSLMYRASAAVASCAAPNQPGVVCTFDRSNPTGTAAGSSRALRCGSCSSCSSCTSCTSCFSCFSCASCGSCSSCSSCTCSCSSCASCSSCGSCAGCSECGSCASCGGCGSCASCNSCAVLVA